MRRSGPPRWSLDPTATYFCAAAGAGVRLVAHHWPPHLEPSSIPRGARPLERAHSSNVHHDPLLQLEITGALQIDSGFFRDLVGLVDARHDAPTPSQKGTLFKYFLQVTPMSPIYLLLPSRLGVKLTSPSALPPA